jgi:hypothetical protein
MADHPSGLRCSINVSTNSQVFIEASVNAMPLKVITKQRLTNIALGGLMVACLPLDPRLAGSNPAENDGFLRVIKNP